MDKPWSVNISYQCACLSLKEILNEGMDVNSQADNGVSLRGAEERCPSALKTSTHKVYVWLRFSNPNEALLPAAFTDPLFPFDL